MSETPQGGGAADSPQGGAAADYEYDLAHEALPRAGTPADPVAAPLTRNLRAPTEQDGDYGYDLAHDVRR